MQRATEIKIPFNTSNWNHICIWAIEQYGLPGDKYTWHPLGSYMKFHFKDEKDAIHFSLRWS
jgi:hypothetical protein